MNDDCVQCREWEVCPFHPKEELSWADLAHANHRQLTEAEEYEYRAAFWPKPISPEEEVPTVRSLDIPTAIVRVSSADGETVLTYDNGRLVDEEPAEAYTGWYFLGSLVLEVDYSGCTAIGVGGYHSEHYGDPDSCCEWCGAKQG